MHAETVQCICLIVDKCRSAEPCNSDCNLLTIQHMKESHGAAAGRLQIMIPRPEIVHPFGRKAYGHRNPYNHPKFGSILRVRQFKDHQGAL